MSRKVSFQATIDEQGTILARMVGPEVTRCGFRKGREVNSWVDLDVAGYYIVTASVHLK